MKYFLDTEFIEGFHKPLFGKRRHFIDLVSIGIIREDGATYYAISNEFNYNDADKWVKENVLDPLVDEFVLSHSGDRRSWAMDRIENKGDVGAIRAVQNYHGKSNKRIAEEIMMFVYPEQSKGFIGNEEEFISRGKQYGWTGEQPEFYGYYSDYDWVLFCSLFGRMIDLPKGFQMYCIDLKQMLDEASKVYTIKNPITSTDTVGRGNELEYIKTDKGYPKQKNEHNALADAKWNFELYKFLQSI